VTLSACRRAAITDGSILLSHFSIMIWGALTMAVALKLTL
jgi:hypothetical protein